MLIYFRSRNAFSKADYFNIELSVENILDLEYFIAHSLYTVKVSDIATMLRHVFFIIAYKQR